MRFGAALLVALAAAAPAVADMTETVTVGGQARHFQLHIPPGQAGVLPLIVAYHGIGGNGGLFGYQIRFDALADARHFIAAYPSGLGRHWNVSLTPAGGPDDVAFTQAMIARIATLHPVGKVYAAGMSDGGMFVHALACSGRVRLGAIAAVSGLMPAMLAPACPHAPATSVLQVAATQDPAMPFGGGRVHVPPPANLVVSFGSTLAGWALADGCAMPRVTGRTRHLVMLDAPNCTSGRAVTGLSVDSRGHSWSGEGTHEDFPLNTSAVVVGFLLDH